MQNENRKLLVFTKQVESDFKRLEGRISLQEVNHSLRDIAQLFLVDCVAVLLIWFAKKPQVYLSSDACVSFSQKPDYTLGNSEFAWMGNCLASQRKILVQEIQSCLDGEDVAVFYADSDRIHDQGLYVRTILFQQIFLLNIFDFRTAANLLIPTLGLLPFLAFYTALLPKIILLIVFLLLRSSSQFV